MASLFATGFYGLHCISFSVNIRSCRGLHIVIYIFFFFSILVVCFTAYDYLKEWQKCSNFKSNFNIDKLQVLSYLSTLQVQYSVLIL